ncbi:unnamed protein product [Darwinula stevensoni]|uniref:Uncharacterized protein n=1 Tax=Darwinula stevensoni TaxID=69355 RepID=A0A7R9FRK3_9CRUS|nr:unnamed protein product [Darwinula stevensoni]CAG0901868.1 unnamed protein product [Darwinula stevensoni]
MSNMFCLLLILFFAGDVISICEVGGLPPFPPLRNKTITIPKDQKTLDFECLTRGYPEVLLVTAWNVTCINREAFHAVIFTGTCEGLAVGLAALLLIAGVGGVYFYFRAREATIPNHGFNLPTPDQEVINPPPDQGVIWVRDDIFVTQEDEEELREEGGYVSFVVRKIEVMDGVKEKIRENLQGLCDFLDKNGKDKHVLFDEVPLTLGIEDPLNEKRLSEHWKISRFKGNIEGKEDAKEPLDSIYAVVDTIQRRNMLVNTLKHVYEKEVGFVDSIGRLRGISPNSIVVVTADQILGWHSNKEIVILDIFGSNWRNYLRMVSSSQKNVTIVMEHEVLQRGKYSELCAILKTPIISVPENKKKLLSDMENTGMKRKWMMEELDETKWDILNWQDENNYHGAQVSKSTPSSPANQHDTNSRLKVIFGPPNSGKSIELLKRIEYLVAHRRDNPYGILLLHMGSTLSQNEFFKHLGGHKLDELDIALVPKSLSPRDIIKFDRVKEVQRKFLSSKIHMLVDDYCIQAATTEEEKKEWEHILEEMNKMEDHLILTIVFQAHAKGGRQISIEELKSFFKEQEPKVEVLELSQCYSAYFNDPELLQHICRNETNEQLLLEAKSLYTESRGGALVNGPKPLCYSMRYSCPGKHGNYRCKGKASCMRYIASFMSFCSVLEELKKTKSEKKNKDPVRILMTDKDLMEFMDEYSKGKNVGELRFIHPKDFRGCESNVSITVNVEDSWLLESLSRAKTDLWIIDFLPDHQDVWRTMQEEKKVEEKEVKDLPIDEQTTNRLVHVGNFKERDLEVLAVRMGMASFWAIWIASVMTWVALETSSAEEMERESGRDETSSSQPYKSQGYSGVLVKVNCQNDGQVV